MDTVLRALAMYAIVLICLRLTGKRTLGQVTTFDFVLLLIIGESTQEALIGEDYSMTTSVLIICTLITADLSLSKLKQWWPMAEKLVDDAPIVLVVEGRPLQDRLDGEGVDVDDILESARELHGLERLDQIKYAILERNGKISVIPKQ